MRQFFHLAIAYLLIAMPVAALCHDRGIGIVADVGRFLTILAGIYVLVGAWVLPPVLLVCAFNGGRRRLGDFRALFYPTFSK